MKYAILAVLCLAASVFAAPPAFTYDAGTRTFSYTSASDLDSMVDPLGVGRDLTNPAAMSGNLTKDAFNALGGLQVIGLNGIDATYGTHRATSTLTAAYDATHTVAFTDFGDPGGYPISGYNSVGKSQYSGANTWDTMGTNEAQPGAAGTYHTDTIGLNWFAASISVNEANAGVSAVGFLVDGRDDQPTGVGNIWVTLSDTTEVSFPYVAFGGTDPAIYPHGIGFFYQAPAGLFVTRVEATRDPGSGNSYNAIDDLSFVIGRSTPLLPHAGDCQNDGHCDVVDLGILAKNYDSTGLAHGSNQSWGLADFNDDGNVDVVDLGILAKNYDWAGAPAGSSAVPEPMTLSLLAVGAAALIRRKW